MSQVEIITSKKKLKIPNRFEVLLLNDDYTSMEFVVEVLKRFFHKEFLVAEAIMLKIHIDCLLYTSPSPRDAHESRMPSSA